MRWGALGGRPHPPRSLAVGSSHSASPGGIVTSVTCDSVTVRPTHTWAIRRIITANTVTWQYQDHCFLHTQAETQTSHKVASRVHTHKAAWDSGDQCLCEAPYLLSTVASTGANGSQVLFLPLVPHVVHFSIIIASGLICINTQESTVKHPQLNKILILRVEP